MYIPIDLQGVVDGLAYAELTRVVEMCSVRKTVAQVWRSYLTKDEIAAIRDVANSPHSKIPIIKEIKSRMNLSLCDAKFLVDWIEAEVKQEATK